MADNPIYDKTATTLPKYRFQLFNPDTQEIITLRTAPIEWKEGIIEIKRDINIGGVFTSFVNSSLTFVKEGRNFINNIWLEKGVNGKCDLIVSYFQTSTRTYIEMPSRFSLDFATCKPAVKVGKFAIGFLVDCKKSSLLVKLENRRNVEVDLTKTNSLGGFPILHDDWNLNKQINFPTLDKRFQTEWISGYINENNYPIANNKNYNIFTQFEMNFRANEFTEADTVPYLTGITNKSNIKRCFENSTETREITIYYDVIINVTNRKGGFLSPENVYAVIVDVLDGYQVVETHRIMDVGKYQQRELASGSLNLIIAHGNSIRIYIQTDDTDNIAANLVYSYFRLVQNVAQYAERTIESFPIYEAFQRLLQHITDTQFPFYSDFFGRTDTSKNLNGDYYAAENQESFANLMTGLNLRGAGTFDENSPLPVSFDKLFKAANSIWNLGYSQELIDGFQRIRIEPFEDFFDNSIVLDLSDRVSLLDIEGEVMTELCYSKIKSGFKDFTYEQINGRGEFNTEHTRTTVLNTDSELNLVSDIRGDSMGITQKIIQPLDTEDSEEDNELFILKTQRDGLNWKPEKEENITIVNNSSIFGADTFNLFFSPLRMMLRHANRIKGSLLLNLDQYIRFQTSDKMQTLETTGEGVTIKENQDYLVNDLATGIFKPMKYTVTCKFTFSDFQAIESNKKGYIIFTPEIKGYLLSLKKKNDEDKATIEIIEKV